MPYTIHLTKSGCEPLKIKHETALELEGISPITSKECYAKYIAGFLNSETFDFTTGTVRKRLFSLIENNSFMSIKEKHGVFVVKVQNNLEFDNQVLMYIQTQIFLLMENIDDENESEMGKEFSFDSVMFYDLREVDLTKLVIVKLTPRKQLVMSTQNGFTKNLVASIGISVKDAKEMLKARQAKERA